VSNLISIAYSIHTMMAVLKINWSFKNIFPFFIFQYVQSDLPWYIMFTLQKVAELWREYFLLKIITTFYRKKEKNYPISKIKFKQQNKLSPLDVIWNLLSRYFNGCSLIYDHAWMIMLEKVCRYHIEKMTLEKKSMTPWPSSLGLKYRNMLLLW
jgi:hypothetical protein